MPWLFPHVCILCHERSDQDVDLCSACEKDLPWMRYACPHCGVALETDVACCGQCLQKPPVFDGVRCLFQYEFPIPKLISDLKFFERVLVGRVLGELMAKRYRNPTVKPELLLPVPLHRKRLIERGFNQAVEVAKIVSKRLNIPLDRHSCERIRHTEPQTELLAVDRRKNLRHAFEVKKPISAKHVAIIDDVVTTGSTVSELTKVLKGHGVERVEVWCVARAK